MDLGLSSFIGLEYHLIAPLDGLHCGGEKHILFRLTCQPLKKGQSGQSCWGEKATHTCTVMCKRTHMHIMCDLKALHILTKLQGKSAAFAPKVNL